MFFFMFLISDIKHVFNVFFILTLMFFTTMVVPDSRIFQKRWSVVSASSTRSESLMTSRAGLSSNHQRNTDTFAVTTRTNLAIADRTRVSYGHKVTTR